MIQSLNKYSISITILVAALFCNISLPADTLILRNGKRYTNVKSRIVEKKIFITLKNGRTLTFPAASVKSVVPGVVNWKKPEPVQKPEPEKKTELEKKTESVQHNSNRGSIFKNPYMMAAQSLVPGWSGLYLTDHYLYGILLGSLELYTSYRLSPYLSAPIPRENNLFEIFLISGPPPHGFRLKPEELYPLIASFNEVNAPGGRYTSRSSYMENRTHFSTALAGLLLIDAVVSFIIARESENLSKQIDYFINTNLQAGSNMNHNFSGKQTETSGTLGIRLFF